MFGLLSIVTITTAARKGAGKGILMQLGNDLVEAKFVRRVNRFLAVATISGQETSVHVANSGRLRELLVPGAEVLLKPAYAPGRKTAYDLALVMADGVLVSADARLPNALVAEAVAGGSMAGHEGTMRVTRESTFGESRFDLLLESETERRYVEVKSCTLVENGVGLFPDSPTTRGARHLNTLAEAVESGFRASVIFVAQRPDAIAFATNDDADPDLAEAFRDAVSRGVEAYAFNCRVTQQEVMLDQRLPIVPIASISAGRRGRS